jgi:hypothetical protein
VHRFNVSIKDKLADAESGGAARCSRSLTGLRSSDSGRTLGALPRTTWILLFCDKLTGTNLKELGVT